MDSNVLLRTIAEAAADKKAEDIVLLDVRGMTSYADFIVIASGASNRQVGAIGDGVEQGVGKAGGPRVNGREGYEQGVWVLVDFGEAVVHVFDKEQRELFDLEGLWEAAPRINWNTANPPKQLFGATPGVREKSAPAAKKPERKETTRVAPSRGTAKRSAAKLKAEKSGGKTTGAAKKKKPVPGRSRTR